jgi:site-specific DNA recombinase
VSALNIPGSSKSGKHGRPLAAGPAAKVDTPRVAFYTRISTDEDHQKYSLGAQKERLEAFSKAQWGDAWQLHKVYRDTESGTHMNRPGLEEMLYDAGNQAFNTLLVFRVDRLSRKVRELAQMVDELTKNGVTLKSITEPFDTSNAAGKMMLQMLGVFAEFEHATIVERTKVGMEKKAKGGSFVGGNVPYGYRLDPEKGLVVHEEEAVIVRKMFQMYALGREGASAISKQLNEAGHRNRNGRKWGRRVVLYMLKNPVYVGKIRWREVLYEGHHDPLVSEVLFEKANQVLQERHEDLKGRQWHNGDERLLTGIVKCSRCNSHMFGGGGYKKGVHVPYYVCSKRYNDHDCEQDYVRADLLESAIIEDIKAMFRDEQFMARVWAEANKRLCAEKPNLEKEIAKVEAEAAKAQTALDRYFEAFEAGTLQAELCNQKVRDLRAGSKNWRPKNGSWRPGENGWSCRPSTATCWRRSWRTLSGSSFPIQAHGDPPRLRVFAAGVWEKLREQAHAGGRPASGPPPASLAARATRCANGCGAFSSGASRAWRSGRGRPGGFRTRPRRRWSRRCWRRATPCPALARGG